MGRLLGYEGIVTPLSTPAKQVSFEDRLADMLPEGGALIWIDITRFRDITEMLGLRVGEELVRQIHSRLAPLVSSSGIYAHTGASQFAVFLPRADVEDAGRLATELIKAVEEPFVLNGIDMFVSAAAGIALAPEHGQTVTELTQSANTALYLSRNTYRGGYVVYERTAGEAVRNRTQLAADLRNALTRNELELFYQPQVDLDGEVRALEALLRWRHPQRGLLLPGHFIDVAEETGIIVPIGSWVIEEACRRCVLWNSERERPIKVCVNVSALQFYFSDLAEVVRGAVERTGLPPHLLELELTETVLLRDVHKCSNDLEAIRALGVTIAIDDFGAGYSGLSYLRKLPVDVVKIDRSFISDLKPGGMPSLVAAITSMAHGLGLRVVAEGIERSDQMELLRGLAVDLVQGYLIGRPRRLSDSEPV
jgi:diguanylate cyclase (GGDEF)-like protein